MHFEEDTFLAELVELGVAIEEAGRDELVENTHDQRGEDGEEDVVKRERPGFKDDLAGKGVLKGILLPCVSERVFSDHQIIDIPKIESYTKQCFCRKNRE